jgi:hypothetical protein
MNALLLCLGTFSLIAVISTLVFVSASISSSKISRLEDSFLTQDLDQVD